MRSWPPMETRAGNDLAAIEDARVCLKSNGKDNPVQRTTRRSPGKNGLSRPGLRPSSVFHLLEPLSYEVIILLKAAAGNKFAHANMENFFHAYHGTAISLRGHDLKGLGIAPGPHYQRIFRKVLNAKLNGKIKTAQEELDFAKKLKSPGSGEHFRKEA